MPAGKPAGERCTNLDADNRCTVYEIRPKVCRDFKADPDTCGGSFSEALKLIGELEKATSGKH
jgi:Fe-S-cluster containining protein